MTNQNKRKEGFRPLAKAATKPKSSPKPECRLDRDEGFNAEEFTDWDDEWEDDWIELGFEMIGAPELHEWDDWPRHEIEGNSD